MNNDYVNDELDAKVVAAMRSLYAAPSGSDYWNALEQRITGELARAASSTYDTSWWNELARWAAPGVAAAALLLAVAGAVWSQLDRADMSSTYDDFTQPMIADAMPGAAALLSAPHDGTSQREATLTYVLSH